MRVKGGPRGHLRHKKVLKLTKGQRGSKHLLFRRANEAMLKSLWYSFRDRRTRKRDLRKLWIARINAAARRVCDYPASGGFGRIVPSEVFDCMENARASARQQVALKTGTTIRKG